jgi:ribonuclease VapC
LIVVDTSVLIAIALGEPDAERWKRAIFDADGILISAVTLTETLIVARGRGCYDRMHALIASFGMVVEPPTESRARRSERL